MSTEWSTIGADLGEAGCLQEDGPGVSVSTADSAGETPPRQEPIEVRRDRVWRAIAANVGGGGAWDLAEANGLYGPEGAHMQEVSWLLICRLPREMVPELSWREALELRHARDKHRAKAVDAWRAGRGWLTSQG
jgi:hypothetical protein